MIAFFANLFGYVLNFLYEFVGNFGWAILLFSIIVKLIMLPISIKQQKTMKKSQKINEEMKQIQFKYRNDPEKLNQEIMDLYKRENMSPFSGCFSAIAQIILLFAVFYLVRSPLTYMRKVDNGIIEKAEQQVQQEGSTTNYKEIAIINYINNVKNGKNPEESKENQEQSTENQENNETANTENIEVKEEENAEIEENPNNNENLEEFKIEDYIDELSVNMEFLGIDLSKVPTEDVTNIKVFIIPTLYVISSFISIKISTDASKKKDKNLIGDGKNVPKESEYDAMEEANKRMSFFMPLMSISIALIAPLGLALYWLVNNILMIVEKIVLDKFIDRKEEEAIRNA